MLSTKNTFEGLQFRIMEALEKAKGVPLTALELSQRLHEGEYRDELFDTVNFKVTRAVHAMKDKGKLILSDARDREGRLTYQLPKRVLFARADADVRPPANPVLSADAAQKIITVPQKFEDDEKQDNTYRGGNGGTIYAGGIMDDIVAFISRSSHPVTTTDLLKEFRSRYPATWTDIKVKTIIAGHMLHLFKKVKRVQRKPTGSHNQFAYFTMHTGTGPVQTVAPAATGLKRPQHGTNVSARLIAYLDKAEQPMTSRELVTQIGSDLWPDGQRHQARMDTLLNAMVKSGKISHRRNTRPGNGAKFEFYTKKTGKAPTALELSDEMRVVPEIPPIQSVSPVGQLVHPPKPAPIVQSEPKKVEQVPDGKVVFRPGAKKVEKCQFNIDITTELRNRVNACAKQFDVSVTQFVTDALEFAMEYIPND